MSKRWTIRLDRSLATTLGCLRLVPKVTVSELGDAVWVRGEELDEALERVLRRLPHDGLFLIESDDQLRRADQRVPCAYLPAGPWTPIAEWLRPQAPLAALAARTAGRVLLRLERSQSVAESNVLVTALATWTVYGTAAPQVRLERWRFAVSADARVVVHGAPLPPIPGQHYVEHEGIAVPAGWALTPAVDAKTVCSLLDIADGDLALVKPDRTWEHIRASDFVRATRSAIRVSAGNDLSLLRRSCVT